MPGSGRLLEEGNDDPLQYSCLKNPMGRGAWQATVHGVAKSWTRLSDYTAETKENEPKDKGGNCSYSRLLCR